MEDKEEKIDYETKIEATIERLEEGNKRFMNSILDGKLQDGARRDELTKTQTPWAIVLSCADSRVVPELAFDTGLGELFVLRVAGNVANTSTIASIEYAVAHIGTPVIVVMGHQGCGAVTEAIKQEDMGTNINHLLSYINPAIEALGVDAPHDAIVRKNAELNAQVLSDQSEIIKGAVDGNRLRIVHGHYSLDTGKVELSH